MKKNLFLDSLKYLNVDTREETSPIPSLILQEKKDIPPFPTEQRRQPNLIYLGKGETYTDPTEAYQALLSLPEKDLPEGYRNKLTKAFLKGTEHGQINSIFKDWKKYKSKILPKISEFFSYIKNNRDKFQICKNYISFVIQNKNPINEETFQESVVDLMFFKFWVLFKFFVESKGK